MPPQNYALGRGRLTISGYTTVSVHFFGVFLLSAVIARIIHYILSFVKGFRQNYSKQKTRQTQSMFSAFGVNDIIIQVYCPLCQKAGAFQDRLYLLCLRNFPRQERTSFRRCFRPRHLRAFQEPREIRLSKRHRRR